MSIYTNGFVVLFNPTEKKDDLVLSSFFSSLVWVYIDSVHAHGMSIFIARVFYI